MKSGPRIVLVLPPSLWVEDDRLEPPLGLLYCAAVLRERGFDQVTLYDLSGCHNEGEAQEALCRLPEADIYGLSVVCTTHAYAKQAVARIRRISPRAHVVAGGPNPTALPQETHRLLGVDTVVVGEGEDAFAELVQQVADGSPVFGVKRGSGRRDVDTYPFPARDLVDMDSYHKTLLGMKSIPMITSRGCPYGCIHCNSIVMGGGARGARYRSVSNVIHEIESLPRPRVIRFCDDNFSANPKLIDLLTRMAPLDLHFRAFGRADDLTPETCKALRAAGCRHITVGLESMNPDNLKTIGKKKLIDQQPNVAFARKQGIRVRASFMVGLPYDTDDSIEHYFSEASKLAVDEFEVHPLIPFPGTPVARNPEKWGYEIVGDSDFTSYVLVGHQRRTTYALRHRNFGPDDVRRWRQRAGDILSGSGKIYMRDSKTAH